VDGPGGAGAPGRPRHAVRRHERRAARRRRRARPNLLWLRESEPHLDRVITWNAGTNVHMLAINEAMGFRLLDEWHTWRLEL
jgi:hypothetical protein